MITSGAAKTGGKAKVKVVKAKKDISKKAKEFLRGVEDAFKKGKLDKKISSVVNKIKKSNRSLSEKTKDINDFLSGLRKKDYIKGFISDKSGNYRIGVID